MSIDFLSFVTALSRFLECFHGATRHRIDLAFSVVAPCPNTPPTTENTPPPNKATGKTTPPIYPRSLSPRFLVRTYGFWYFGSVFPLVNVRGLTVESVFFPLSISPPLVCCDLFVLDRILSLMGGGRSRIADFFEEPQKFHQKRNPSCDFSVSALTRVLVKRLTCVATAHPPAV